jgi:hypothetical protein
MAALKETSYVDRCRMIAFLDGLDGKALAQLIERGVVTPPEHVTARRQVLVNKFCFGPLMPTLTLVRWNLRTISEEEYQELVVQRRSAYETS